MHSANAASASTTKSRSETPSSELPSRRRTELRRRGLPVEWIAGASERADPRANVGPSPAVGHSTRSRSSISTYASR